MAALTPMYEQIIAALEEKNRSLDQYIEDVEQELKPLQARVAELTAERDLLTETNKNLYFELSNLKLKHPIHGVWLQ